jgi:probable rRNA maturation factor
MTLLTSSREKKKFNPNLVEVSVLFLGDEEMCRLNTQYRKKNKPTDVLAFPAQFPCSKLPVLGDIVVSIPTAEKQALELGHSLWEEVAFLLIHGFLHLVGYDHHTARERKKMFPRQDFLFEKFFSKKKPLSLVQ